MIFKLIIRNILGNLKKTILSVIGICFSVMLIFVCINAYIAFQQMRLDNVYDAYGEYNIVMHDIDKESVQWIKGICDNSSQTGLHKIIAITENNIVITDSDHNSIDMNRYELIDGRYPECTNEVTISATAKIGDEYVISRYSVGNEIQLNNNKYTIVGILNDYNYSTVDVYSTALVKSEDNMMGYYNMYIHCGSKKTYYQISENIKQHFNLTEDNIFSGDRNTGFTSDYTMILNCDVNAIEIDGKGSTQDIEIGKLLIMIIMILVLTSTILGIYIFASYLRDRNSQQGILLTLGFSNIQTIMIYFGESLVLVFLGTFFGVFVGRYLTQGLFVIVQKIRVTALINFKPHFSLWSYVVSCIIGSSGFIVGLILTLCRNMSERINEIIKVRKKKTIRKNTAVNMKRRKYKTFKYVFNDSYTFEKVCVYISLTIIGLSCILIINVNKYVKYKVINEEKYDTQFDLMSDDISEMEGFEKLIPHLSYYDMVYDTTGLFYFDKSDINEKCLESVRDKDGGLYCEIVGVSELQYNNKIGLSSEMSYKEFVNSGGAIVIDNITGKGNVLKELPQTVKYAEKTGELGANFPAGQVDIVARSTFKNWNDQNGISLVLPEDLFKKQFDYTTVLIKINAEKGHEIEVAEKLNEYAALYNYTFWDNATAYIKEKDNDITIKLCTYGIFIFVLIINFMIILYTNVSIYMCRKRDISILKMIGHSDFNIMKPIIVELLFQSSAAAIISLFISRLISEKILPYQTMDIILSAQGRTALLVFLLMFVTEVVSIIVIAIKVRMQTIIYDLRV